MAGRIAREWARRWVGGAAVLALLLLAVAALAAGRIQWSKTTLQEREDKSWKVEIAIFLPRPPDVAHVPMKFEFKQVVYYERTMIDGDKIVERKVPMENKQELIEGVDVGFLDPATGKTESRTKFVFRVTRAHGYEAGEYTVTVRDGRSGQLVGTPTRLVFEGENETIDRRTMVFSGEGKKKKQMKDVDRDGNVKDGDAGASAAKGEEGASEGEAKEGEEAPEPAEAAEAPAEEKPDAPAPIKEKPGGCGCRAAAPGGPGSGALALVGLGVIAARRRRQAA